MQVADKRLLATWSEDSQVHDAHAGDGILDDGAKIVCFRRMASWICYLLVWRDQNVTAASWEWAQRAAGCR
jgi:hypothetical protein